MQRLIVSHDLVLDAAAGDPAILPGRLPQPRGHFLRPLCAKANTAAARTTLDGSSAHGASRSNCPATASRAAPGRSSPRSSPLSAIDPNSPSRSTRCTSAATSRARNGTTATVTAYTEP